MPENIVKGLGSDNGNFYSCMLFLKFFSSQYYKISILYWNIVDL